MPIVGYAVADDARVRFLVLRPKSGPAQFHPPLPLEAKRPGSQLWVIERTRSRGKALRAARSKWRGSRQAIDREAMT
jgi:hypothetical protein